MGCTPWPVLWVIARWYGMPEPAEESGRRPESVRECALAWGFRSREVQLGERWWSEDLGPLIGYRERDGAPVALLPSRGGYSMYDPEQDSRVRVTEREARALRCEATMPYRGGAGARLLRLVLRGSGHDLRLIAASGAVTVLAAVLGPLLAGLVLGRIAPRGQVALLLGLGCAVLAFGAAAAAVNFVREVAALRLRGRAGLAVQAAMWGRLLATPGSELSGWSRARIGKAVMGADSLRDELVSSGLTVGLAGLTAACQLALLLFVSGWTGLLALGAAVLGTAGCVALLRLQGRAERRAFSVEQRLSELTAQLVNGVAQLRSGHAEERAFSRWREVFTEHRAVSTRARVFGDVAVGAALAGYALCATLALTARPLPADPVARITALVALGVLGCALYEGASAMTRAVRVVPKVDEAVRILRAPAEPARVWCDLVDLRGKLVLREVSFRYRPGDAPALDGMSFEVEPGEFVALAGPAGSGKSTVLQLLLGFARPGCGSVICDGKDPSNPAGGSGRQWGVVLQNAPVLAGDIGSSIIGGGNHTMDDAWQAAADVGLDTTIAAMPMGMRTVLVDGAPALSRAQRQQLALARALLGRPRFLLLDDAASALDERSAHLVDRTVAAHDATRLVVTDRLSTMRRADRVIVLDRGRVVQQGDCETLLRDRGGALYRLLRRQF